MTGADAGRGMMDEKSQDIVTLTVPSHPKFLYVIRSALYPVIIDAGFTKKDARRMILAVDEACSNIIKYAYEGDYTRPILLTVTIEPTRLSIQLKDSGKKADTSKIAPRDLTDIRPGGLGTHFMGMVFDTVTYDTNQEQGTLLTLEKKKHP